MDELKFIQTESARYLLFLAFALLWLTLLSIFSRLSALPPRERGWVNLLSLATGPPGWAIHFLSRRRAEPVSTEIDREPGESSAESEEVAPAHLSSPSRNWKFWKRWAPGPQGIRSDMQNFNALMLAATEQKATDIHIESHATHSLARFRVNGILRNHETYTKETGERLISIAKVMASVNVADKLKPQEGRFEWSSPDQSLTLDIRLSVTPSLRGEKLALRFLNRPASSIDMPSLGMNEAMQQALKRTIRHPEGFILIAGPTGSGKTSTAYSLLTQLSGAAVNIMTIEDPVEYSLPYATQTAINPKLGITFKTGFTTLLRQDPDIILIGEMREPDSFQTAIRASLSGHLVISTMHARDSIQVFANLRDLQIEPSSLAASVKLVVAQRLVRILCPHCKIQDVEFDDDIWNFLGAEAEHTPVYQPGDGCDHCFGSGFVGRTGVFEFIQMSNTIKEWLEQGQHETDLRRKLDEQNFQTMRDDARAKVFSGQVWVQDAIRATGLEIA
ncbi:MAG TPA: GspE/PulE family protein [Opitutales bacterium]|nr:GspE/PulE family protein [Opitutales bacterium]